MAKRLTAWPLWQVGFRPFFALAMISGMILPVLWALAHAGWLALPAREFGVVQWHAHEMFYGFGWAVIGGFLLTSTKNWVGVRGFHGGALVFLAAAWLFDRAGMGLGGNWPSALFWLSSELFMVAIVAMLMWTLLKHHTADSYRDNFFFLLILPLFPFAKHLALDMEHYLLGWGMTLGLFRMAFLLMLERTLVPFMKGAFQAAILRHPVLDMPIKSLALLLVFAGLLPDALVASVALLLATLLVVRFAYWKPLLAFTRLDIGIMHLGYLAIVIQLLVEVYRLFAPASELASLAIHVFTFGAIGLIAPAMLIRISQGHTGRKVVFDRQDKFVLQAMIAAFVLRVVLPVALPGNYAVWIALAAACWFAAFGLLAWRYIPMLLRPRVDGKEH